MRKARSSTRCLSPFSDNWVSLVCNNIAIWYIPLPKIAVYSWQTGPIWYDSLSISYHITQADSVSLFPLFSSPLSASLPTIISLSILVWVKWNLYQFNVHPLTYAQVYSHLNSKAEAQTRAVKRHKILTLWQRKILVWLSSWKWHRTIIFHHQAFCKMRSLTRTPTDLCRLCLDI